MEFIHILTAFYHPAIILVFHTHLVIIDTSKYAHVELHRVTFFDIDFL